MVKKGATSRRGRKPSSIPPKSPSVAGTPAAPKAVPKETVARKPKQFSGKLSHASPVSDLSSREKKITGYFTSIKLEDAGQAQCDAREVGDSQKSLALNRIFSNNSTKGGSPVNNIVESSPHKILLNDATEPEPSEVPKQPVKPPDEDSPLVDGLLKEPKVKATKAKRKLNVNQSLNQDTSQNHKLTEYFAVRRSVRKPKTAILEEKQRCLEEAVQSGREEGLQVHNFPGKGRGIIANCLFRRGEFVVEYSGDLIDLAEARLREKIYAADQNTGCYMYYFQHRNQSYCIDATAESHRLGRLVNHSRQSANLIPKVIEIKDRPYLLLVARCDIMPGEELLYDYGDRSRDSLKHHPWLAT